MSKPAMGANDSVIMLTGASWPTGLQGGMAPDGGNGPGEPVSGKVKVDPGPTIAVRATSPQFGDGNTVKKNVSVRVWHPSVTWIQNS